MNIVGSSKWSLPNVCPDGMVRMAVTYTNTFYVVTVNLNIGIPSL